MGACVSTITLPYDFGPTENSIFGICFVIFGIVGSFVAGRLLDKSKKFKKLYVIWGFLLMIAVVTTYIGIISRNVVFCALMISVLGFAVLPFLPMSFEFGAELTYPAG